MRWGCRTGSVDTIRLTVKYGADVNIVGDENLTGAKILTLSLAAKHRRADAFECLLRLGSWFHDVDLPPDIRAQQASHLVTHVCKCAASNNQSERDVVRIFYDWALDWQVKRCGHGPDVYWPLVKLIASGVSVDVVRLLLDRGADVNRLDSYKHITFLSPLSAAIFANSADVFRLLISRGANIHGTPLSKPTFGCLHVPVFAAAHMIATSEHGIEMMRLCLDNGADINQTVLLVGLPSGIVYEHSRWNCDRYPQSYLGTPIWVFLDSITSWSEDSVPDLIEALDFLHEQKASTATPAVGFPHYYEGPIYPQFLQPVKLLEMLLNKWYVRILRLPRGLEVIATLINHGAAEDTTWFLVRYSLRSPWPFLGSKRLDREQVWEGLAKLAETFITNLPPDQLNKVLCGYINELWLENRRVIRLNEAVIGFMLAAGANINARFGALGMEAPGGKTILQMICAELNTPVPGRGLRPHSTNGLLRFLISREADPHLLFQGKTCFDILLEDLGRYHIDTQEELIAWTRILMGDRGVIPRGTSHWLEGP
ncbi:putative ankyrin repeat protein [Phaeoacremonium minimum UCRPA7]|uniref:Putative ankyrin repeat protein n=1 Tax=Phaeoacremonium minimum (strain UCR-PA7) TaxID=1286976 RepID=R8BPG6_PHAM7|nr:putative ankyrin repeat protein [Phaeoacremonium minimum UCRPA7]EOO01232.1 putative ankyrin repeat protein [Phaeoacremonium minimum UCRPA7]